MRKFLGAMLLLLFSSLTGAVSADHASWRADLGAGNHITLSTDQKCSNPTVLGMLRPEKRAEFKNASLQWEGRKIGACWTSVQSGGQSYVYVVDEEGDHGPIPDSLFKKHYTV